MTHTYTVAVIPAKAGIQAIIKAHAVGQHLQIRLRPLRGVILQAGFRPSPEWRSGGFQMLSPIMETSINSDCPLEPYLFLPSCRGKV